jgi:multiple sugar transport system substrate-binding protein
VDYQPIPTDFQTRVKAQMAGGTAPDVMYIDNQLITAFGPTNQLLALDDYMAEAGTAPGDFIEKLMSVFTVSGKVYALPKDWGSLALMYLPEAFTGAGIDMPTANWTWDDLQKAADAINKAGKYKAYCMGPDWARFAPFVYQNGGRLVSDDFRTSSLDSEAVRGAATFIAGLKTSGLLVTPADVGASWCGEALGKQLVAMTYEGGWMVNFMNQNYKVVKYNDVPLPAGPKGQANIIFTNGIGVNAATKFPKAAAALAIFLTSPYNQAQIQQTGFAYSAHPDQLDQITNPIDKNIAVAADWPNTGIEWFGPYTGKFETVISNALSRVFLGQQNVDESFRQAHQEAGPVLAGQ